MAETDLGLSSLPAKEHELAVLHAIEVDEAGPELLHLDPLRSKGPDGLLESLAQVLQLGVQPGLELMVGLVDRVGLRTPELGETLLLLLDLREPTDPATQARKELLELGKAGVRLRHRPQTGRADRRMVAVSVSASRPFHPTLSRCNPRALYTKAIGTG